MTRAKHLKFPKPSKKDDGICFVIGLVIVIGALLILIISLWSGSGHSIKKDILEEPTKEEIVESYKRTNYPEWMYVTKKIGVKE